MACLEKSRAKRPQTARDLAHLLEKCPSTNAWTTEQGDSWWNRHERGLKGEAANSALENPSTTDVRLDRTIDGW